MTPRTALHLLQLRLSAYDPSVDAWQLNAIKLIVAVVVGLIIGIEREIRGKPAGVRTMILISLGSTLFTIFSYLPAPMKDPSRIAAQIVTGIGFLGAGAILHDRRGVTGMTTAASIWLVASLGVGIGFGQFRTIAWSMATVLFVLLFFYPLERWFDKWRHDQTYEFLLSADAAQIDEVRKRAELHGLKVMDIQIGKGADLIELLFRAVGKSSSHRAFVQELLGDPTVRSFSRFSNNRETSS